MKLIQIPTVLPWFLYLWCTLSLFSSTYGFHSIDDYGAVAGENSIAAAAQNAKAVVAALTAAAKGSSGGDRTVVVPAGGLGAYYTHAIQWHSFTGVTLQVDGILRAHDDIDAWPRDDQNRSLDVLSFSDCRQFTLTGKGTVDGQGYNWWWWAIIGGATHAWRDSRPHLIHFERCAGIVIEMVRLINSPQFHVKLDDCADLVARHMEIWVDVEKQRQLLSAHGLLVRLPSLGSNWRVNKSAKIEIPTFPLNTDGFDPSVNGVHIYNVTIENFDDAVAVKPCSTSPDHSYCNCSSNVLVENSRVVNGVGMTIGSVPPNDGVNCVSNITFRNIEFSHPFKAIYIKTNPGDSGSGIISNVTYENIVVHEAIWWAIYIGPQQQEQPDGSGPGCMLYPLENCPTQPRVPIRDVTLRNVTMIGGVNPFAGLVRCNASNPCTGFLFDSVRVTELLDTENYIVEFVEGVAIDSLPVPGFMPPRGEVTRRNRPAGRLLLRRREKRMQTRQL